jgi:hypothetical protein
MPQRKKVTICASILLNNEINEWKKKLEQNGYTVIQYPRQLTGKFLPNYAKEFTGHYQKISESDIVLALNIQRNGIKGYIGAGVFAEIAFAIGLNRTSHFNKKIDVYCLNPFSGSLPYSEELQYWLDLGWLKFWK